MSETRQEAARADEGVRFSVGDAVRIGDRVITLIESKNGEAAFRVDVLLSARHRLRIGRRLPPGRIITADSHPAQNEQRCAANKTGAGQDLRSASTGDLTPRQSVRPSDEFTRRAPTQPREAHQARIPDRPGNRGRGPNRHSSADETHGLAASRNTTELVEMGDFHHLAAIRRQPAERQPPARARR